MELNYKKGNRIPVFNIHYNVIVIFFETMFQYLQQMNIKANMVGKIEKSTRFLQNVYIFHSLNSNFTYHCV
jgi:hypothetical protein